MRVFVFYLQAFCKPESVCFFGFRHFVRRCCAVFSYEFIGLLKLELFFNEGVCFFGFRHFVRRCCAVFSYEFIGFLRPELFFQWECLFFWLQAFCKTALCRFFIWIYRVFKARIVFSMSVFVFLVSGIL